MITDFKEIEKSALNLDRKNKARLADILLQSIHEDIDPEIEQASIQEVQKRKESLESGEASFHDRYQWQGAFGMFGDSESELRMTDSVFGCPSHT